MDQETAAIWAAGIAAIAGVGGAVAGGALTAWAMRRQVKDQAQADLGHWLRDQRRSAFAAVLERADEVASTLGAVISARVQPDWDEGGDHRELWAPCNEALGRLQQSATTVAVMGPSSMERLAQEICDASLAKANSWREPGLAFDERTSRYSEATELVRRTRLTFVSTAREVLESTEQAD
jgi:hypothetical protein